MIDTRRMAAVDRNATALGVPRRALMESSGNAVARAVRAVADEDAVVAVLCGRGDNGGDAMVTARFLDDLDVTVHLLGHPDRIASDIARANWRALERAEVDREVVRDSTALDLGGPDVVVDGLLGTGAAGAPREPVASAVEQANAADATVVAVDVPTGVDADTGDRPGVAVDADRVVTFHDRKPGLAGVEGVTVADIGIPTTAERFVGPGDLAGLDRDPTSHKGDHGEVLVVGGGPYAGAPALTARAAMRAGADLVRVACPAPVAETVQSADLGLIVEPLDGERVEPSHVDRLVDRADAHDATVLGPGLGDADATADAVREFLTAHEGRTIVDADALRVVPEADTEATLVCTPHAGEFRELGGDLAPDAPRTERVTAVASLADRLGATVLLKGPHDVVGDGDRTRVARTGTPAMTVGGTGDVLAGVVGALTARLTDTVDAAGVAAYATGLAGERAADGRENGLLASDLPDELPAVLGGAAGDRI